MKSRLEKAEQHARRAGYSGAFPPPPKPVVEDVLDFSYLLARVQAGDQRANLIAQLAVHAVNFFDALPPERFAKMGRVLIEIARDPATARRTRIRAVQAAIRPIMELIRRVRKLERMPVQHGDLLEKLERSAMAFVAEFARTNGENRTRLVELADMLFEVATQGTAKNRYDQVGAVDTALRIVTQMMDLLIDVQADAQRGRVADRQHEPDKRRLDQAESDLARLEDELDDELRNERARKTIEADISDGSQASKQADKENSYAEVS